MGGTDGFSEEHPSGGGRGSGRGFSLFMGQPSHISPPREPPIVDHAAEQS